MLSVTKRCRGSEFFRFVFLTAAVAVFCLVSACQSKDPAQSETKTQAVTQIDDAKIKDLLKPKGKPLLVNFWATWCGPCREEFPDLVEIDAEYRGKVDFITVSLDFVEDMEKVPVFLTEVKAEMPTYLLVSADENALISSISREWSGALPFTILYNEKGEVAYSRQGMVNPATLTGQIDKALGEK